MSFRFRRSVKIAPGLRLNFTHKSASVRVGPRGAGFTASTTGRRHVSAGIPGSGIHVSQQIAPPKKDRDMAPKPIDLLADERPLTIGGKIALVVVGLLTLITVAIVVVGLTA